MSLHDFLSEINEIPLSAPLLQRVSSMLPTDDAELDELLSSALQRMAHGEFVAVICAAIASDRPVQPRHLARGGIVLAAAEILPEIVMRMPEGDVPECLLQMGEVNIPRRHKALMLAVTALWCRLHRGSDFPQKLIEQARDLARDHDDDQSIPNWLAAVAIITGDQGLLGVLRRTYPVFARESEWMKVKLAENSFEKQLIAIPEESILHRFGDGGGGRLLAHGTTMRRAVVRVGRNEPCPCGSGRKYKKCCYEKDQDRLRHSTSIEGVTTHELDAAPEAHLDAESFASLPWERLERIDPSELPESLIQPYFERLLEMEIFDRIVDDFEKVGYREVLHGTWRSVALRVAARREPELVRRLLVLRRQAGFEDDDLDDIIRFCEVEDDPAAWVTLLEERIDNSLHDDDPNALAHLAQATAYSSYPAIGVFVCRSVSPLLPPEQLSGILEFLVMARDSLGHLSEDPIVEVLDRLTARKRDDAEHSESERETALALEATRRELRELKEKIARIQRDSERAEAEIRESARKNATNPEDNPYFLQMRRTNRALKAESKDAHKQMHEYRRMWEETQQELQNLKSQPRSAPEKIVSDSKDEADDDLVLPADPATVQPVRLIQFAKGSEVRLGQVPIQIARAAMATLGRLAAGDAHAFQGAVRLKAVPTVTRVRLGRDWRLLFRLLADQIEVVDLIPRQDLERRIKTLTS